MLKITDALTAEHRVFLDLFTQVERSLPDLTTVAEVRLLAVLLERLLESHADTERNLAYAALDHVLRHEGRLDRMHQDHQEIDATLARIRETEDFSEARRLLRTAIGTSRDHFRLEELQLFPLLEQTLLPDTLVALGDARLHAPALRAV